MRMQGLTGVALAAVLLAGTAAGADSNADEALKNDAIARLAASHEPDVPLSVGRLAVRQAGIVATRELLARRGKEAGLDRGWNPTAPEWREAEARFRAIVDDLIARGIEDKSWLQAIWAEQAARILNAEEADEIATHFDTPNGREQREVIEIKVVGELMLASYTFTDRINNTIGGAEPEFSRMQQVWADREPFRVRNFDGDPGAARFASRNPGVKYVKMLATQGVDAMLRHVDAICAEAVRAVSSASAQADPFIEAYRRRAAG
jgi:hypothetical protein